MKYAAQFWDERYSREEYVYGLEPNTFLREQLLNMDPGKILLPAEGEGRNAVFAAGSGWMVDAFDMSLEGRKKALALASRNRVSINYRVFNAADVSYDPEAFDVLGLIYANFPAEIRKNIHRKLVSCLKPGGIVIFESFSKDQLEYQEKYNSGGPKEFKMLFSEDEIRDEFPDLQFRSIDKIVTELSEGSFHSGLASVIRFVGIKS